jgi:hypothetical protein
MAELNFRSSTTPEATIGSNIQTEGLTRTIAPEITPARTVRNRVLQAMHT